MLFVNFAFPKSDLSDIPPIQTTRIQVVIHFVAALL